MSVRKVFMHLSTYVGKGEDEQVIGLRHVFHGDVRDPWLIDAAKHELDWRLREIDAAAERAEQ